MSKRLKPLAIGFQVDGHTDSVQVGFAGGIAGRIRHSENGWRFTAEGEFKFVGGSVDTIAGNLPEWRAQSVVLPRRLRPAAGLCRATLAEMLAELHRLCGDKPAEYAGRQDARRLLRPLPRAWREAEGV